MAKNYDGEPTPAGSVSKPADPTPGAGHTNNAQGLGSRRSNQSFQRHFGQPAGMESYAVSQDFWTEFINTTKERYSNAPDLNLVQLKHAMHPNTAIPQLGDDLDKVATEESYAKSKVMPPNTNWPLPGPTARRRGPAGDQNPFYASVDATRINYLFMEARKDRYGSEGG